MGNFTRIRDQTKHQFASCVEFIANSFSRDELRFYVDCHNRIRHVTVGFDFSDADLKRLLGLDQLVSFSARHFRGDFPHLTDVSASLLSLHPRMCAVELNDCPNVSVEALDAIFNNKWIRWMNVGGE